MTPIMLGIRATELLAEAGTSPDPVASLGLARDDAAWSAWVVLYAPTASWTQPGSATRSQP